MLADACFEDARHETTVVAGVRADAHSRSHLRHRARSQAGAAGAGHAAASRSSRSRDGRFAISIAAGSLDPYEDWRLAVERRVADLVGRMTLEERAGTLMHGTAPSPRGGPPSVGYDVAAAERIILGAHVHTLLTRLGGDAAFLAEQNNRLQEDRRAVTAGRPADDQHRSAKSFPVRRGRQRRVRELLEVAGDARTGRHRRSRAGAPLRRHRAAGVSRRGDPHGAVATSRPGHRAAVAAHLGHLRRGPRPRARARPGLHRGLPARHRGPCTRQRRHGREALGRATALPSTASTATTTTAVTRGSTARSTSMSGRSKGRLPPGCRA